MYGDVTSLSKRQRYTLAAHTRSLSPAKLDLVSRQYHSRRASDIAPHNSLALAVSVKCDLAEMRRVSREKDISKMLLEMLEQSFRDHLFSRDLLSAATNSGDIIWIQVPGIGDFTGIPPFRPSRQSLTKSSIKLLSFLPSFAGSISSGHPIPENQEFFARGDAIGTVFTRIHARTR